MKFKEQFPILLFLAGPLFFYALTQGSTFSLLIRYLAFGVATGWMVANYARLYRFGRTGRFWN
jgi:hypothetical protein